MTAAEELAAKMVEKRVEELANKLVAEKLAKKLAAEKLVRELDEELAADKLAQELAANKMAEELDASMVAVAADKLVVAPKRALGDELVSESPPPPPKRKAGRPKGSKNVTCITPRTTRARVPKKSAKIIDNLIGEEEQRAAEEKKNERASMRMAKKNWEEEAGLAEA